MWFVHVGSVRGSREATAWHPDGLLGNRSLLYESHSCWRIIGEIQANGEVMGWVYTKGLSEWSDGKNSYLVTPPAMQVTPSRRYLAVANCNGTPPPSPPIPND